MPPQARVGDRSMVSADAHGCPSCPHPAVGPAVQGSPNVFVNGLPGVRVGDKGIHAACCGPNLWNAKTGSRSVVINGKPAHRLNDLVRHCGGIGMTIQGSPNVLVGDYSGAGIARSESSSDEELEPLIVRFVYYDNEPVRKRTFSATRSSSSHTGITNEDGIGVISKVKAGSYTTIIEGADYIVLCAKMG